MFRRIAEHLLYRLQALKPYRVLIRRLFRGNVRYRVAASGDAPGLYRLYGYERSPDPEDPAEIFDREYDSREGFQYTVVASVKDHVAGATVIRRFPDHETLYTDWWIFGTQVRLRCRGAGIGEGLVRTALEKASGAGAVRINLMVDENNRAAVRLYGKMGFRQTSLPGLDDKLEREAQEGKGRRIIMSTKLSGGIY